MTASEILPFNWRASLHNLDYYTELTDQLQRNAEKNKLEAFRNGMLGKCLCSANCRKRTGLIQMTSICAERVQRAVLTICPDVAIETHDWRRASACDEGSLRRQFMTCLLSSQVRYELACAAALEIEDAGILLSSAPDAIAAGLRAILARPFRVVRANAALPVLQHEGLPARAQLGHHSGRGGPRITGRRLRG